MISYHNQRAAVLRVTTEPHVARASNWDRAKGEFGSGRARPRSGARSLKDALSDAGFGEAPAPRHEPARSSDGYSTDGYDASRDLREPVARGGAHAVDPAPALRTLLASLMPSAEAKAEAPLMRQVPASSVVSPPPWLRAKRRGRVHSAVLNTFGWVMTLIVVGSIVGLAGRYLVVPPPGGVHIQARQ
jgi:hypothetical protein